MVVDSLKVAINQGGKQRILLPLLGAQNIEEKFT
jgi:hypothetical protein